MLKYKMHTLVFSFLSCSQRFSDWQSLVLKSSISAMYLEIIPEMSISPVGPQTKNNSGIKIADNFILYEH